MVYNELWYEAWFVTCIFTTAKESVATFFNFSRVPMYEPLFMRKHRWITFYCPVAHSLLVFSWVLLNAVWRMVYLFVLTTPSFTHGKAEWTCKQYAFKSFLSDYFPGSALRLSSAAFPEQWRGSNGIKYQWFRWCNLDIMCMCISAEVAAMLYTAKNGFDVYI